MNLYIMNYRIKTKTGNSNCKRIMLASLFFVSFVFSMQSQITIGVKSAPLKGVLLDLKESNELNGNSNSKSGMMMARVFLHEIDSLAPMLTNADLNYETLKPSYTGLIVYNVNATAPLEKGLYIWDGNIWNKLNTTSQQNNTVANNGLNLLEDTIKLGGDLGQNTAINLLNYNLNLNPVSGRIGIGTASPQAVMQIENPDSIDPLILKNVKLVSDANNTLDGTGTANYTALSVSDSGVVRKATPAAAFNANASFIYNLTSNTNINTGDASGTGGNVLAWTLGSNPSSSNITLPETGTYIFTFRLYGHNNETTSSANVTQDASNSYYINAFKNNNLVFTQEFLLHTAGFVTNGPYESMTYSITVPVSGTANDTVYFTVGKKTGGSNIPLTLVSGSNTQANRTSMVFWKL